MREQQQQTQVEPNQLGACIPITLPITLAVAGGFARIGEAFKSDYEQYADRIGQQFTVLGQVDPDCYDFDECGPMYRIQFADGTQIDAWPEEVEVPVDS